MRNMYLYIACKIYEYILLQYYYILLWLCVSVNRLKCGQPENNGVSIPTGTSPTVYIYSAKYSDRYLYNINVSYYNITVRQCQYMHIS